MTPPVGRQIYAVAQQQIPVRIHRSIAALDHRRGHHRAVLSGGSSRGASDGPVGVFTAASIHNSLGIAILALALLRILWRVVELPPAPPATMKSYEIALARTVHIAFYFLLFAIPING